MIKLNMIIVILFAFTFSLHAEEERPELTGEANIFFEFYRNMFNAVDVHAFSGFLVVIVSILRKNIFVILVGFYAVLGLMTVGSINIPNPKNMIYIG